MMTYERVIEYCENNDLTISAFERVCKLSNGTVGKWKTGKYPSVRTLVKMQKCTGISITDWLGGESIVRH